MDAIKYPVVSVGGVPYVVRFSMLAQYMLDSMGVDLRSINEVLRADKPGKVSLFMKLWAACVAHEFESKGAAVPSPEWWAARVTPDEWKAMCQGVVDSLTKIPQSAVTLREADAKQGAPIQ
jgi:hypothetical protein